jgi:hypothetical protein
MDLEYFIPHQNIKHFIKMAVISKAYFELGEQFFYLVGYLFVYITVVNEVF